MPPQFLKSYPDIRLQILDHMAHMYRPVGIGQGTGYEDSSLFLGHGQVIAQGRMGYWARLCHGQQDLIDVFELFEHMLVAGLLVGFLCRHKATFDKLH